MTIERLHPGPRMCQAVIHGGMVYLAGQVAEKAEDVEGQTREILGQVDALLAEAGTDKSRILTATVYLADIGQFAAMNRAWEAWVDPRNPPARATVEARLATPRHLVEVVVTAAR